jgi:hypothetical protein
MTASEERQRKIASDLEIDPTRDLPGPRWGLRTGFRMMAMVVQFLDQEGPQTPVAIARFLVSDSPTADQPNPRRTTGMSSANQAIVTMTNLGLVERIHGRASLTSSGHRLAESLGSPDQPRVFRDILLSNDAFVWFWKRASLGARTIGRNDLLRLAAIMYPDYNEETRKTLAGVCLNYARNAGLVREGPGGSRYLVVPVHRSHAWFPPGSEEDSPSPAQSIVTGTDVPPSADSAGAADSLSEAGRLLGWILADETLLGDVHVKNRVRNAFANAIATHAEKADLALVRLAAHEASHAVEASDPQLMRWAVRLVNGLLALDQESTQSDGRVS